MIQKKAVIGALIKVRVAKYRYAPFMQSLQQKSLCDQRLSP
jgi:hypothetical protein